MGTQTRYPTASEIASQLGGKRAGTGWIMRCVVHDDAHASLSIGESQDGTRVLWKCHANCSQDSVKDALIARGIWPSDIVNPTLIAARPAVRPLASTNTRARQVAVYVYRNADGETVHETVRYEPKAFRQRAVRADGSHEWTLANVRTVLYRLPELLASDGPVWIVEGEKDADNLTAAGGIATSVPMGAGKWRPYYADWLTDRDVRIIPDNDRAGVAGAMTIAAALEGIARSVTVVHLPSSEVGADVSDFLAAGGTPDDLERLCVNQSVQSIAPSETASKPMAETADGFPLTDLGNAERMLLRYGKDLRYCVEWKTWLLWTGSYWQRDNGDHQVRRLAVDTVLDLTNVASYDQSPDITAQQRTSLVKHSERSQSSRSIANMIDMARSRPGVIVSPGELDRDPWLLNFSNVTYDLKSGHVAPPARSDLITKMVRWNGQPATYDHERPPRSALWESFLKRVLPDEEVRRFVQTAMGYSLIGITSERIMLILYGIGKNGKSTFIEACQAAIGEYSLTVPSSLFLATRDQRGGGSATPDIASLYRVRLVTSQETPEGGRLDESRVKWITGNDTISARNLYESPFTFEPTHTVWLSTNHRPVVRTGGEAIWDRMRPVPFLERIRPDEMRVDLKERLRAELHAITAWIIAGARMYTETGLVSPAAVLGATANYKEDSDWFGGFLENRCTVSAYAIALAGELHRSYNNWAVENNERPMTPTALGNALRERGFQSHKTGNGHRAWKGLSINSSAGD